MQVETCILINNLKKTNLKIYYYNHLLFPKGILSKQLKLFDDNNLLIKYYAYKRGNLDRFVRSNSRITSNRLSLEKIMGPDECLLLLGMPKIRPFIKSCIFRSTLHTLS